MTTLIEALVSIDVDHWDTLADDLERLANAAKRIDTDIFAALDLVRAEWVHIYDYEKPTQRFDQGTWAYPMGGEWRLSRVAGHVRRVLDGLIADLVREAVA